MRRVGSAVAMALSVATIAACTSRDGSASRPERTSRPAAQTTGTTTPPAPPPVGVLVPGGSITLGAANAEVQAGFSDGTFRFTSRLDDRQLDFASDEGSLRSSEGIPLRCGNLARTSQQDELQEITEVSGATSRLVVEDADGAGVAITAVSPPAAEVNPRALTGIPSGELLSSVFVTPAVAEQLADQPADVPLTIERWAHEFDVGLAVEADLSGSLARELSYRFRFSGAGQQGVSTNLLGIPCNERSVATRATPTASYQLVLLVGGAVLRVDGEAQTDTVTDPAMQGEWAVAEVTAVAETADVEVISRDGTRLDHWTLSYTDPDEVD